MITTSSVVERLYHDRQFNAFLRQQARRHFHNTTFQQDAIAEAWEKVCSHLAYEDFQRVALNAINAYYDRVSRRRAHETPLPDGNG